MSGQSVPGELLQAVRAGLLGSYQTLIGQLWNKDADWSGHVFYLLQDPDRTVLKDKRWFVKIWLLISFKTLTGQLGNMSVTGEGKFALSKFWSDTVDSSETQPLIGQHTQKRMWSWLFSDPARWTALQHNKCCWLVRAGKVREVETNTVSSAFSW